ncbi:hypothetical protein M9Y10_006415 [Tritrichomonas musculus]|uniref:Protein kinase domain-containing protein n=1 Tax=Tritrichomonas musculus TaxID=1915356 RepID=A0ABR2JEQ3_9EUKA
MEAFNRIPLLNNLNNYINLNMICEGAYGKIYLCEERNSKQKYIIKKSKEQLTEEDEPYFKNEIQSLPSLDHPAILKFHGFLIDHQYPTFVTDYMLNKSLDQILKLQKKDISRFWTVTKRYINFVGICI